MESVRSFKTWYLQASAHGVTTQNTSTPSPPSEQSHAERRCYGKHRPSRYYWIPQRAPFWASSVRITETWTTQYTGQCIRVPSVCGVSACLLISVLNTQIHKWNERQEAERQSMITYRGVEIKLTTLLISTLYWDESSASRSSRFISGYKTLGTHCVKCLCIPRNGLDATRYT
jgi:hypothetical protein